MYRSPHWATYTSAALLSVGCVVGCTNAKTPATPPVPPSVFGVIRDRDGGWVPGVQVVATCGTEKRETMSNSRGSYRFDSVPERRCRIEAYLPGFRRSVAEAVVVAANRETVQDFVLRSAIVIASGEVAPPGGLAGAVQAADTVLYLRVEEVVGPVLLGRSQELLMTEHRAVILAVVKSRSASIVPGVVVPFWQFGAGTVIDEGRPYVGDVTPYSAGQELVSFFKRDSAGRLVEMADGSLVFQVADGRVVWHGRATAGIRDGMPIGTFLEVLKKMVNR